MSHQDDQNGDQCEISTERVDGHRKHDRFIDRIQQRADNGPDGDQREDAKLQKRRDGGSF